MEKNLFSAVVLLFLFVASSLALDPITAVYSRAAYLTAKSPLIDYSSEDQTYIPSVKITWSAEPSSAQESEAKYDVKIKIEVAEIVPQDRVSFKNWNLELCGSEDRFIDSDAPWEKGKSSYGGLKFTQTRWNYSFSEQSPQYIYYQAKIQKGNTVITPPSNIIFSGQHMGATALPYSVTYDIQKDDEAPLP